MRVGSLCERLREAGYLALPSTLPMADEDGTPLCIEMWTPVWGKPEAGYEWEVTIVDDFLISETGGYGIADATIAATIAS